MEETEKGWNMSINHTNLYKKGGPVNVDQIKGGSLFICKALQSITYSFENLVLHFFFCT